ncbi:MAG TPA: DNA-3-methyladenine glycosylase I [Candidatus Limnocylindrales bacterium]
MDPLKMANHDTEWGVPATSDLELFGRLALESFQVGLAWVTTLRKREAFRRAFDGFDPVAIARYDEAARARLPGDLGIVRNKAKVDATIGNAAAFLAVVAEHGGGAYLAGLLPRPAPRLAADATGRSVPAATPESDMLSADLKSVPSNSSAQPLSTPSRSVSGWSTTICQAVSATATETARRRAVGPRSRAAQ